MRYMTEQGRHDDKKPPGRPLWQAAERKRVSEGISKFDWAKELGLGRVTYDRLTTQENRPIARTVKKIADRIGLDYDEAMRLAGYPTSEPVSVVLQGRAGVIRLRASAGEIHVEARNFDYQAAEEQIEALRAAGQETGRTLGEVLVSTGLAEPEELKVAEEGETSAAIGGEVAETARSRRGSD